MNKKMHESSNAETRFVYRVSGANDTRAVSERLGVSGTNGTMERPRQRLQPQRRGLTKSLSEPTKTREVSMATPKHIPNYTHAESAVRLPAGEWVLRRGVRVFVPEPPTRRTSRRRCHCGARFTGLSCPACLAWAERDAELWNNMRISQKNRPIVWHILALRERVAA